MTIQEAIKSGKPFRRKWWGKDRPRDWYVKRKPEYRMSYNLWDIRELYTNLTSDGSAELLRDILATDWEVKP